MKILGIESSCDETAAAVVEDGRTILSNIIASQVEEHRIYGGVVPEIAARRHAEALYVLNASVNMLCRLSVYRYMICPRLDKILDIAFRAFYHQMHVEKHFTVLPQI